MNCMKCGRDTGPDQAFCEECLAEMEQYPVKPDVVVLLPNRPAASAVKKAHQRRQTPEEQVAVLEKRCRRLVATVILLVTILTGLAVGAGIVIKEMDMHRFIGQNYSSYEQTETTGAADIP